MNSCDWTNANFRFLVRSSYRLADSQEYQRVKRFVYTLLEDPDSRIRPYFDVSMMILVLASVTALVYETYGELGVYGFLFEAVVVTIFIVEYLLRMWIYSDAHRIVIEHYERAQFVDEAFSAGPAIREILASKWAYIRSPLAIIDLLAIIPTYRPMRMLRLFLLFRLFKLFRYAHSFSGFGQVLKEKRFELMALSTFLAFIVFSAAASLVIFEVDNPDSRINGIFDGVYWALITVSTVGYGDIVPASPEGRLVSLLLILAGLGTFSFLGSIIVSGFSERLPDMRLRQVFSELERRTGHTIVVGFGRVGQEICSSLTKDGTRFVVVESDEQLFRMARRLGYLAAMGNAESEELMDSLRVDKASRILCLTDDDVINVYVTVSARYRNKEIEIIARANHPESVTKLGRAGADRVVTLHESVGRIAAQFVGQPVAFEAVSEALRLTPGVGVDAIRVDDGAGLIGSDVAELDLDLHKLILFGVLSARSDVSDAASHSYAVRSRRFFFNPAPEFRLQKDDLLIVFGHDLSVQRYKELLTRASR